MREELERINTLLTRLHAQAETYDQDKNNLRRSFHASLFNEQLFKSSGKRLVPFVEEAITLLNQLQHQVDKKSPQSLVRYQCDKLLDQCKALTLALNSSNQQQKASARDQQVRKAVALRRHRNQPQQKNNKFEWLSNSIMANSHELYQELSKHHGYERKLSDKIASLESQLANYQGADKIGLQQTILKQHQRLGQCRKAIYFIEQKIQQMEKGRTR